jgi:hypothetical protein
VGAVKVRKPRRLMRNVADIRDLYDYRDEFKFNRISRGKFAMFCQLIDTLKQSDARIAACVVDQASEANPFATSGPDWMAHARVTSALLAGNINRQELAAALVDQVTTPRNAAFDDTVREMVNRHMQSTSLVSVACADSTSTDGLQLADLIAGAVAYQRGHGTESTSPSSHKGKIAARLAAAFGVDGFDEDVHTSRVNISTFSTGDPNVHKYTSWTFQNAS